MNTGSPFLPLPAISVDYRFRLSAPSYVYPADILPNVEALAPSVDNIELSLFDSEPRGKLPSPETVERLLQLAEAHDLTYTVHLPFDHQLGSPLASERLALQQQIVKIITLLRPLDPLAYILHIEGIDPTADRSTIRTWQKTVLGLLPGIIEPAKDPSLICVENLFYPFEWCDEFLDTFGLSVCMDTGHLTLSGGDVHCHLQRYSNRISAIHLHGTQEGHDHLSLKVLPMTWLRQFLNSIDNFTGVLTLELFNGEALRQSMERLSQCLTRHSRDPNSKSQTPNSK